MDSSSLSVASVPTDCKEHFRCNFLHKNTSVDCPYCQSPEVSTETFAQALIISNLTPIINTRNSLYIFSVRLPLLCNYAAMYFFPVSISIIDISAIIKNRNKELKSTSKNSKLRFWESGMHRNRKTQKQTLSLKSFSHLASSSPRPLALQKHRFKLRSSSLLVGLTATVGITSIAFAATQQTVSPKSNQTNKASTSTSTPLVNQHSVDANVKIQSSTDADGTTQQTDGNVQGSSAINNGNTQVTINNETIPVDNGTVERTFTDSNGSTYSVKVNVDSNSTSDSSSRSHTDINIHSSGTSSTDNATRGSPRR